METPNITKKYSNGEISIIWKPALCIHSTNCWKGLPEVFKPREKPWIVPENADSETIIQHVKNCPSGALSIEKKDEVSAENIVVEGKNIEPLKMDVTPNGPILIHGNCNINFNGETTEKSGVTALCRCGASSNKPYCDGSHAKIGFQG